MDAAPPAISTCGPRGSGNDAENIRAVICEVASLPLDDGVLFGVRGATAVVVRDEDACSDVRVTMKAELTTARPHFHVDVNVGDPITPAPQEVHLPRLLGREVTVRGYPLVMVHAEKIVTEVARGTANTRWRDFADIHLLSRRHPLAGVDLAGSVRHVARHRQVELVPLARALDGYGETGQARWAAWRRERQLLIVADLYERGAEAVAGNARVSGLVPSPTARSSQRPQCDLYTSARWSTCKTLTIPAPSSIS